MASKMALLLLSFLAISCFGRVVHGDPVVPCYFIFGDSLADNGNNNNLQTSAKVNYAPYGIDLPSVGPSGRFTNAQTMVDFISLSLSLHVLRSVNSFFLVSPALIFFTSQGFLSSQAVTMISSVLK